MALADNNGNNPVDQTPNPETTPPTNHKTVNTVLIILIILLIGAVAYLTMGSKSEQPNNQRTDNTQTPTPSPTPTPTPTPNPTPNPSFTQSTTANWKSFTSSKCTLGYTLLYPPTFSVNENADCNLVIKVENGLPLFDFYTVAGTQSAYVTSMKERMVGEKQSSVSIAGVTGVRLDGEFAESVGIEYDHTGSSGSSVIFTKNNRVFVFNAYDSGDRSPDYNNMIKNLSY